MKGVDVAALERRDRILDKTGLVERVRMDRDCNVQLLGDAEAGVDCRRGRSPILVKLQSAGAGLDHLDERARVRSIAFAEETEIDRQPFRCFQYPAQMPRAWRAGRRRGAGSRSGAAPEHCRDAAVERFLDQLRTDEVDVRVDAAGGD